jgi:ubiquinone/menaquinone biosynthesis C-methylase UbiE
MLRPAAAETSIVNRPSTHREQILDQFTRQAAKFQETHRSAEAALQLAVSLSQASATDTVLDVACGPGVVACALAQVAQHVTGIDITPTMLEHARQLQAAKQLDNVTWQLGDVARLPFPDGEFSLVVSRYAIHHLEEPAVVVAEMTRACKPGGRVVLIDSAPAPHQAEAFNATERIRDPSHTRALSPEELHGLMSGAGLNVMKNHLYAWEVTAGGLIDRSCPLPGDADKLRRIYADDVGTDRIGMNARYLDGALHVTFPTLIVVGIKPAR